MFPKKTMNKTKTVTDSWIKKPIIRKSISLIINTHNLSNSNIKQNYRPNNSNKTSYLEESYKGSIYSNKNKNKKPSMYNLTLKRQNSQSSLYSLKHYLNEAQKTNVNNINKRQNKCHSYRLCEVKTPKIIELLNNKKIKKKNYVETYNNDSCRDNNYSKKHNKSKSTLSLRDYQKYSNLKNIRNYEILSKLVQESNKDSYYNKTIKNKYNNRYDRNKCVIERRVYGGEKQKKKNIENNIINKELPNIGSYSYNKMIVNGVKLSQNKIKNLKHINISEKIDTNINNNYKKKDINNKNSSNKLLLQSKAIHHKLSDSSEHLTDYNRIINTTNINNISSGEGKDIKFILINKSDLVNESSQDSTNQIGNSISNKITLNNTNIGYKKDNFISSFLNGPEDIHYKFVELHKQRKIFYENLCYKLGEDGNSIDNKRNNDFDICEYSEYFENYNENVPII